MNSFCNQAPLRKQAHRSPARAGRYASSPQIHLWQTEHPENGIAPPAWDKMDVGASYRFMNEWARGKNSYLDFKITHMKPDVQFHRRQNIMVNFKYTLFLIILVIACTISNEKKVISKKDIMKKELKGNTLSKVIEISDNEMLNKGYDLNILKREIMEDSLTYQIKYSIIDTLMLGGGGSIIISKKDLKIIRTVFEQ